MEALQQFLETSLDPVVTAFLPGLMTAISPCPQATNITVIGFISKDIANQRKPGIRNLCNPLRLDNSF